MMTFGKSMPIDPRTESVATDVVDAAFTVHRHLGSGLLENVYEVCLAHELGQRGHAVQRQVAMPVIYSGIRFELGYKLDLLVDACVIVELKTVERILPVHQAQLLSYMKLANVRLGLLINFNTALIKDGIKRMVNRPTRDEREKSAARVWSQVHGALESSQAGKGGTWCLGVFVVQSERVG
jgi:GxxExxY protein